MSSKKTLTEFRVGIFVAAVLALAMVVLFTLSSHGGLFNREYTLYANFESISGLRIGAPVQLAGLKVGYVDKITFPKELTEKYITVVLRLYKQYQDRIREDSVTTIETQGLLGDKYIYISMGSEAQAVLPDKDRINTKETASIFSLAEKAGGILEDVGKAAEAINGMLTSVKGQKEEGDIKATISSIRRSIEQIEKGKGVLHAMIYDQKGGQTIDDLGEALHSIRDIVAGAEKDGGKRTMGLIANLRDASVDLKNILEAIRNNEGTLGKLVNDPALYDDLRTFLGRANRNSLLRAVVRSTLNENEKQVLK